MVTYQHYAQIQRQVFTVFKMTLEGKSVADISRQSGLIEDYIQKIQSYIKEGKSYQETVNELVQFIFGPQSLREICTEVAWIDKIEKSKAFLEEKEIAELQGKILGVIRYRFSDGVELVRSIVNAQTCLDHLKEWNRYAKKVCDMQEFIEAITDAFYQHPYSYYADELEKMVNSMPEPDEAMEYEADMYFAGRNESEIDLLCELVYARDISLVTACKYLNCSDTAFVDLYERWSKKKG